MRKFYILFLISISFLLMGRRVEAAQCRCFIAPSSTSALCAEKDADGDAVSEGICDTIATEAKEGTLGKLDGVDDATKNNLKGKDVYCVFGKEACTDSAFFTAVNSCNCESGGASPKKTNGLDFGGCLTQATDYQTNTAKDKPSTCTFGARKLFHQQPTSTKTAADTGATSSNGDPFKAPQLSVPIPGMEPFTDIPQSKNMTIPWLAQYMAAGYKYFVGIAVIIAIVLMMIGGFQWMTSGGNAEGVSSGKKRISHAVIGLFLALASYVILYTINPELVTFKGVSIQSIDEEALNDVPEASKQ